MRGAFYKSRQAVKHPFFAMCILPLLSLYVVPVDLSAQGPAAKAAHCFGITVRLNGQSIEGPTTVTLKSRKAEDTVSLAGNCFQVSGAIAESELVEVSFTVPGNKLHMADVPSDFFSGTWEVELADKKFSKDIAVPKRANASEVCAVIIRDGEQTQSIAQPQCRTPLATQAAK